MKNFKLRRLIATAIIVASGYVSYGQTLTPWYITGNANPPISNTSYLGTQGNFALRFATATGGALGTHQKMIITPAGNVGIGYRGIGSVPATIPNNKLLVENGNLFDWTASDGIYDRLKALIPVPVFPLPPIDDADFGFISYSNRAITDGNNFAVVGYSQDALANENVGVLGVSLDGRSNTGTLTAALNGPENTGVRVAARVDPLIPFPPSNSENRGIKVNVEGAFDADNTGIEMDVDGDDADFNKGMYIEVDGNNAVSNDGVVLEVNGTGVTGNNIGYSTNIFGSAVDNKGVVTNISATASNNNYGDQITITGTGVNNTGSDISVTGASTQNQGQHISISGNSQRNLGLDIDVIGNSTVVTGIDAQISGGSSTGNILGAGLYVDGANTQFSVGVWGDAKNAIQGNTGGWFSASAVGGTSPANFGVLAQVPVAGGGLNYGVFADYNGNSASSGFIGNNYAGYFNGDVFSVTNFYASDAKLKENIREFKGALDKLKLLEIKNYTYKTKEYAAMNLPQAEQIGLLAQNLKEVFPGLVKQATYPGSVYGKEDVKFDAVNTNALVPVLVQAVKELDAKNVDTDKLKEELAAVKANSANAIKELEAVKADNETLKRDMVDMKEMLDKICSNGCGDFKPASTLGGTTGSESNLFQNVPNPFSNTTVIPYTIGHGVRQAVLVVTNLDGVEMKRFTTSNAGAGTFELSMGDFSAGTYIYSLFTDGKLIDTKKMILAGK